MDTQELLSPYQHLRGFNYTPSSAVHDIAFWRDYDEASIERELTYAQRLGLNSARVFLAYVVYEREPQQFLQRLRHFVRAAHARGISTMVVVWDSCFDETAPDYDSNEHKWIANPGVQRIGPDFWPCGEQFCEDLVATLRDEPGLLMWDVMNEPLQTSWVMDHAQGEEHAQQIWAFVRHFCQVLQRLDPDHPTTVGVAYVQQLEHIGSYVDVLSFHDYSANRATVRQRIETGLEFTRQLQKPALISEIGCLARANPYDMTLKICFEYGLGWYMWELMIGSSLWRDRHGITYPDGTIRDPSIVAAVQGFFRNRTADAVAPNLDVEGAVTRVLKQAGEWLAGTGAEGKQGLLLLEQMANLMETGEIVPMIDLPTVKVQALARSENVDRAAVKRLLVAWSAILEKYRAA